MRWKHWYVMFFFFFSSVDLQHLNNVLHAVLFFIHSKLLLFLPSFFWAFPIVIFVCGILYSLTHLHNDSIRLDESPEGRLSHWTNRCGKAPAINTTCVVELKVFFDPELKWKIQKMREKRTIRKRRRIFWGWLAKGACVSMCLERNRDRAWCVGISV